MKFSTAKKVVIITEAVIEEPVISLVNQHGASGYTVYHVLHGKGAHGIRAGLGGLEKYGENVRVEVIVTNEERAHALMEALYTNFLLDKYAGIIYMEDINIIRSSKF